MVAQTEAPQSKEIIDRRLGKALSHPLRVRILSVANHRVVSPAEFAREFGEPLPSVSYHFKTLERLECIELVKTEPRRGAVEHFYRGTKRAFLSDAAWKQLPQPLQGGVTGAVLQTFVERAVDALEAGTFDARDDSHLSWTPVILDEEAWQGMASILERTLEQVLDLQAEAAGRLAESGEDGITAIVAVAGFESPAREPTRS